jgi:hypothetical protein
MGAAIVFFVVFVVVATIVVNVALRGWVRETSRREAHFEDPSTHTVAFGIPAGVDPTIIESALMRAGLNCQVGQVGQVECVRIECDESQREQVRLVLKDLHLHGYDGSELDTARVVFEDER